LVSPQSHCPLIWSSRSDCNPSPCLLTISVSLRIHTSHGNTLTGTIICKPIFFFWNNFHANWEWRKMIISFNYSTIYPGTKSFEFVSSYFITYMLIYYIGNFQMQLHLRITKKNLLIYQVVNDSEWYRATIAQRNKIFTYVYIHFLCVDSLIHKRTFHFCLPTLAQMGWQLLVEWVLILWVLDTNSWRGTNYI
jgi:hypothetical protein